VLDSFIYYNKIASRQRLGRVIHRSEVYMKSFIAIVSTSLIFSFTIPGFCADKIGDRLSSVLARSSDNDEVIAWVFFKDKGTHEFMKASVPLNVVSERSLQRRMKVRAENELVDYTDLPVEQQYIDELATHVVRVRQRSKWFNGASVVAAKRQIQEIANLPFVSNLELVYRAKVNHDPEQGSSEPVLDSPGNGGNQIYTLNYGSSFRQDSMVNVPAVHNTGNYAQGVFVGVFDNGVRLINHQAFDSMLIVATYDFVDHKVSVVPNNPSTSFGGHGVNTLSLIGGYKPGTLIGPAFGARFILARTENDSSETPIEEDNWAAAIEWADSIGVDVTSTSLGYDAYDPPYTSWTYLDMNGNTTLITRAADAAVARGIVVCNSAGNAGSNASHNTLGAPADGDSVLTVGALSSSGSRASYSSVGPTTSAPPHIKPDVMAQGSSPMHAGESSITSFTTSGSGTSYSCPIAAGVAALVIKARPNATAMQVINALKSTASNAASPNNLIGWGTVNAVAAINALPLTETPQQTTKPETFQLEQNYPNPFNPLTSITYSLPEDAFVSVRVYNILGQEVKTLMNGQQAAHSHRVVWDGTDTMGKPVASGMYICRLTAVNANGALNTDSKKMMLAK